MMTSQSDQDYSTPAELSRELGVSAKLIRDFLRTRFGLLASRGETRWRLDEVESADVRRHFQRL